MTPVCAVAPSKRNWLLDSSLALYLPLWDSRMKGSPIISQDMRRHSCSVTGAIWTPQGRRFDGLDDVISVIDPASLSALPKLGLMGWIRRTSGTGNEGIISKATGASGSQEWELFCTSDGLLYIYGFSVNSANYLGARGTTDLRDSLPHHVAATWNGVNAAGQISLYVDLVLEALTVDTKQGTGWLPYDSVAPLELGRAEGSNAWCFTGDIGEGVVRSNQSFSDIECHYQSTRGRYQ